MRVGVTGAYGQFGWHLRCRFLIERDIEVVCAGRETFADRDALTAFVRDVDAVVHLAGVNRADEDEILNGNRNLARDLVGALRASGNRPHLIYASSIQVDSDSVYGQSKREAGDILADWAHTSEADFTAIVFPHLYGEYCRPKYNSAVVTFCWQVANGEVPSVHGDGRVELLHFFDASEIILKALHTRNSPEIRPAGREISVRDIASKIEGLARSYKVNVVPDLRDPLDLHLFNVYRGFLYPDYYPVPLKTHADNRGFLAETVKSDNGGQTFFSVTKPGITRGNHFHYHKIERFVVLKGQARISLRRLLDSHVTDLFVDGDNLSYVDIPTLHTHEITNIGDDELVTQFWANEIFDPDRPDTFAEQVRKP